MSQAEFVNSDEETRKQMLNSVRAAPVIATPAAPQTPDETK